MEDAFDFAPGFSVPGALDLEKYFGVSVGPAEQARRVRDKLSVEQIRKILSDKDGVVHSGFRFKLSTGMLWAEDETTGEFPTIHCVAKRCPSAPLPGKIGCERHVKMRSQPGKDFAQGIMDDDWDEDDDFVVSGQPFSFSQVGATGPPAKKARVVVHVDSEDEADTAETRIETFSTPESPKPSTSRDAPPPAPEVSFRSSGSSPPAPEKSGQSSGASSAPDAEISKLLDLFDDGDDAEGNDMDAESD